MKTPFVALRAYGHIVLGIALLTLLATHSASVNAQTGPCDFPEAVILGTNSVHLKNNTQVLSGDIIVNDASPGPTLSSDKELVIENNVEAPNSIIMADSVQLKNNAVVGQVHYNDLDNKGTILGPVVTPLALPVFAELPQFLADPPPPGAGDILVPNKGFLELPPGDYGEIDLENKAVIVFAGGTYRLRTLDAGNDAEILFDAPTRLIIEGKLQTGNKCFFGPADGSGIEPWQIIAYVNGINGSTGALNATPKAAAFGNNNELYANFYVPNGTIDLGNDTIAVGSFFGRDVRVGNNSELALDSFFLNGAPVASDDTATVDEGGTVTMLDRGAASVLVNDVDPNPFDILTATLITAPVNGLLTLNQDGTFTYAHDGRETLSDSFTYEACDDAIPPECRLCDEATVTITVTPINDPPVITEGEAIAVTMDEDGSPIPFSLTLNATDPDSPTLTWSIQTQGSHGTASASGTGSSKDIGYTPDADYNGVDSFVVEVSDGFLTDAITVNVTINPVNDPPVATDDSFQVLEGGTLDSGATSVLDNDSYPDATITLTQITSPGSGTLALDTDGTFVYAHNGAESGSDSFIYQICYDAGPVLCDQATVTFTIVLENDPPLADPQDVFTNGAAPIGITLTGSDPENGDLTFSIVSGPSAGSLGPVVQDPPPLPGNPPGCTPDNGDGVLDPGECITDPGPPRTSATVTYTPNTADNVEDSFTFRVTDPALAIGDAVVRINPLGDPTTPPTPIDTVVANDLSATTSKETPITITLTGDAPEGVDLTFVIVAGSGPANGTLSPLTPGIEVPQRSATITYTPNPGFVSPPDDSFGFQACGTINDVAVCVEATVTITVVQPQAVAHAQVVVTPMDFPVNITLTGSPGFPGGEQGEEDPPLQSRALTAVAKKNPPVLPGGTRAVFEEGAEVAGNVADEDGNSLGDNHNDLPGPTPVLMSAGVDQTGGPGSNGTVRMQMEWHIVDLLPLENEIESAEVILHTNKGSVDTLDTSFYVGTFNQDGLLTDSDYQATPTLIPGVVMPVPDVPAGTEGTFTFDITAQLQDALRNGLTFFSIQGRVDENLAGQGSQRGLQVYTTADGNLAAFLEPQLSITTAGAVHTLTFSIVTLPLLGSTLVDSFGSPITVVPTTLSNGNVTYIPDPDFQGMDSFRFQVDDGLTTATALIDIVVGTGFGLGDCEQDPAFCDEGR